MCVQKLDVIHFLVVIFSSHRTINLCRNKSSFTFWKKNFNKVSDKLLGKLLVLPEAKLKTACTKLVYVPRSLWSNLEQNQNIFWRGYHKASFVGAAWNKYRVFEPLTTSNLHIPYNQYFQILAKNDDFSKYGLIWWFF